MRCVMYINGRPTFTGGILKRLDKERIMKKSWVSSTNAKIAFRYSLLDRPPM